MRSEGETPPRLHGRAAEQERIGRLLGGARDGRGGALVLRGEAGIGKTALLEAAAEAAEGMRVLRGDGIQSEAELPFAGLHLLLSPLQQRIPSLAPSQAAALHSALGLTPASGRDHFLVGLATLTLLSDLAEEAPLLVLVDDAHWLDGSSAAALTFAARRLQAERVAMLFAARNSERGFHAASLPELRLQGLDRAAAAVLLAEGAGWRLSAQARDQLIAQTRGNPLALIELPATLTPAQRTVHPAPHLFAPTPLPTSSWVQAAFAAQIRALPELTQKVLLVAAADGTGELGLVLRAAGTLGASVEDLAPAEHASLLYAQGTTIAFRHPLVRAAAYQRAPLGRRVAAHHALAAALEGEDDADRRAWHLAAATTGPDEAVAAALEEAAGRARGRGGIAAEAAAYERAAQLTTDPQTKATRLAAAADAALKAGHLDHARILAGFANEATRDPRLRARIAATRAQALFQQHGLQAAARIQLDGADPILERDPLFAAELLVSAATCAWMGGDRATADRAVAVFGALRLPSASRVGRLAAAVQGMRQVLAGDFASGLPSMREPATWARATTHQASEPTVELPLEEPIRLAFWAGDLEAVLDLASAQAAACRAHGMLGSFAAVLMYLAWAQLFAGRHEDGRASAAEAVRISQDTGQVHEIAYGDALRAWLAAIEGDQQRCESLAEKAHADAAAREFTPPMALSACALILLDLSLGRYEKALERRGTVPRGTAGDVIMLAYGLPDLIEAAVRAGAPEQARALLDRFQPWASHSGQGWAAALAHRCQALLAADQDAEQHFTQAARLHVGDGRPFEQARTRLAYGQWLNRARRRGDARAHLRAACETFDRLGATSWAQQTRAELRAAGEAPTQPGDPGMLRRLTSQELQVVQLAAAGASNRDIAAQLFISPRTVGYHLYKAYPKLGVASRHGLATLDLG